MNVGGVRFRAPTKTAEEHEADFANCPKKKNYAETFNQSPFTTPCRLLTENNSRGNFKCDSSGSYVYKKQVTDETVPNFEYLFENGIGFDSHPVEWFNFFPLKRVKYTHPKAFTMDDMTAWLNVMAVIAYVGKRVVNMLLLLILQNVNSFHIYPCICCMISRLPLDLT